jgi:hypothetical protein
MAVCVLVWNVMVDLLSVIKCMSVLPRYYVVYKMLPSHTVNPIMAYVNKMSFVLELSGCPDQPDLPDQPEPPTPLSQWG